MAKSKWSVEHDFMWKLGVDTLTTVSMIAYHVDKKNARNTKELFKIIDLVDHYHDIKINGYIATIKLKKALYGEEVLRTCCEFAINVADKIGEDIFKYLHLDKEKSETIRENLLGDNKKGLPSSI